MTKRLRLILAVLALVLVLASAGFVGWASNPARPMPEALAALESDSRVRVESGSWIAFTPEGGSPSTGFIFYPGGLVDARAYAPALRAIAEQGYLVVIVPMPLNLAIFGINRADDVVAAYAGIPHWVIGGHSLGGAMAARYAHDHPDTIDGLVLWASFAEADYSLAGRNIAAASIFGTLDGLAQPDEIATSRATLPADASVVAIEGGNHAQFGDYGDQAGDKPATISRAAQQATAVAATTAVLVRVAGG